MANSDFLDVLSPSALADLQKANVELTTMIKNVSTLNSKKIGTPSGADSSMKTLSAEYAKQEKLIASLQLKLQKASQQQQANAEKTRLAEIKLQQQREKAFDSYEKQIQKEEQALAKAEGAYQRYQNSVNALTATYKNLAIRKELGNTLSIKEEAQLTSITARLNMYQNALKKVDATIGNHQREVGNYAKANSNLSNSIGQISRELPNFGQSFSIGVLSLTNNIGALTDSIKQVKAQNQALKAEGKNTTSVLSQVLGSILSWQTALFIGIGIFSAYSKEIGAFVKDLFSASDAIKASERAMIDAYEAKNRYDMASADASKTTRKEADEYVNLTNVIKDGNKSREERLNAAKRIKEQYPGYLKNFSEEQILAYQSGKANKELSKTLNQLAGDIQKRNLAMSQSNEANKTFSDIADLKEEFKYREAINKQINSKDYNTRELYKKRAEERAKIMNDSEDFVAKFGEATIDDFGQYDIAEINNLKIRYNALVVEFNKERQNINKKLVETSLLDFKPDDKKNDKQKRERIHLNYAEAESEYNLKLAILERQKAQINDRAENEDLSLDIRLKARQEFSEKSIEILELETKKEKALINEKYLDDLQKNNLAYKNKDITSKEWSENIQHLNKRLSNELQTIDLNYSLSWNDLMNANAKFYKDIQDKKKEYTEQTNKLIYESEKASFDKIANDSKKTLTTRQKAFEQSLELSRKELQLNKIKDISNAKSSEEIDLINQRYADALKNLKDLESPLKKAREETDAFISKISGGALEKSLSDLGFSSAKMFLDFDKNGQTTFDKLLEGADTLSEKFALTFNGISEIAQEAFKFISEASNANFENEYANLEKQRDIALFFAGESASAREEIERQYEQRQKAIRRREFQAKKQQAIFNIAIDTAQALVAQLAATPLPFGTGFLAVITALGIAQASVVASQQIPEFWKGTDNAPEGWALTQEKGREIITDKYGNIKSTGSDKGAQYTYLNKGDKVLNNDKTMDFLMFNSDLNNILSNNGINSQIVNVQGNTTDLTPVVNAINNKEGFQLSIDENGFNKRIKNGCSLSIVIL